MRKRLIPAILLLFGFVGIDGCQKTCPRDTGCVSKQSTITLDPAANVAVSEHTFTLTNNSTSQASGFSLVFSNVGSLTCNDVSIKTTAAYGFVPNDSSFIPSPVTSTMPQYTCTKTGSTIVLSSAPPLTEGFHPWVDNFNINMGPTVFTVTVNTPASPNQLLSRGAQTQMYLNPTFTGCGLRGTVLQRVFDCSKKIYNYAVYVDPTSSTNNAIGPFSGTGTSTYYTLFTGSNPELYWFVVGCPSGSGGTVPQQDCAWLTPIVPAGNPALDVGSVGVPTFQLSMLTGYQKRLLFSGKLINGGNGYNFAQSNGFNYSSTNELYVELGTNPGTTPNTGHPIPISSSVCVATTGQSLQDGGTFSSSDAAIRDIVSLETGATIRGAAAGWQMPSYAMFNILTGGKPTKVLGGSACPASGTGPITGRPYCDMPTSVNADNQGFSAINVPGFSMTDSFVPPYLEVLCSSSSSGGIGLAWAFIAFNDTNGGNVGNSGPTALIGVRCAVPAWY